MVVSHAFGETKLLILGDSLSAGYGLDAGQSWVDILATDPSKHIGFNMQILNASVSGETSAGGLSRLPGLLNRHEPDIVLILLGANDGLRGLPLADLKDNLVAIIKLIRKSGAQAFFGGIELPRNYGGPYTRAFRRVQDEIAELTAIPYLPFFLEPIALDRQLFQEDGLHPTLEAQPILADYISQFLQTELSSK